jgi:carboxymethylenebutenolidase
MPHIELEIETRDGVCPAHAYHPDSMGPWPAVLMYMDGIGMRPAVLEVAERIANEGYYVLAPNLFYRVGYNAEYGVRVFEDPESRADLMNRIMPSASPANVMRDTESFLAHFDAQPNVRHGKIGITGYCMGGRLSLYAAGTFGEQIAAAASYHASGLATDAPESPHRLAPRMKARVYVAGAIEDRGWDDAQAARLDAALTEAHVEHKIETYNARHGFVFTDTPVYDEAESEHHYRTLFELLDATVGAARS